MSLYPLAKFLTGIPLRLAGMRVLGKENIPQDQAYVIVANHTSFGDPPALAQAVPQKIIYIGKETFAKNPLTRVIFSACEAVFLNEGESDLTAMRAVIKQLKQGNVVAIFPEGKRNLDQEMSEFLPGAAFIAHRAQVAILPVGLINCGDYWRFWRRNIIVNIGQPIIVESEGRLDKETLAEYNNLFAETVSALVMQNKEIIKQEGKKMRSWPKAVE